MRKLMFALAAQAVAVGAVSAQSRPLVAPIVPCPPVVVVPNCPPGTTFVTPGTVPGTTPVTPGTPPGTPEVPGTPPQVPPPVVSAPDVDGGGFARQSEGGTQVARSFAPNMFGDVLGARTLRFQFVVPLLARCGVDGPTTVANGGAAILVNPNAAGGVAVFGPTPNGRTLTALAPLNPGADLRFAQPLGPNGPDPALARSALQTLLSTGGVSPAQAAAFSQLTPAQQQQILRNRGTLNGAVTASTRGLAVQTVTLDPVTATLDGNFINYSTVLRGEQNVALPGAGSVVGRIKISEDTSPLPRDRLIFAYDNFDAVPFTTSGLTVNRYQVGIEKTFLDGRWSAEFRLPFAATLASTSVQGFETTHTELGNLRFALKRIFTQNQVLTTTAGIAATLPTAQDQVALSSLDGSELYRFRNESVTLEPFVAALWTPNERLFAQTWGSVNFDTGGSELVYNPAVFGGSGREKYYDLPYLSLDTQVGYWLIRKDTGALRGLAPFVELHYNYAIAQKEALREVSDRAAGNGLNVSGVADHELNLIAGFTTQIGDQLLLSVGGSAPLLRKPDRTFDAQLGVRASYLYGRTARARNPIYNINSY